MEIVLVIGAVDLLFRVLTLLFLMHHSAVRTGTYRTWVLLVAFVNFAWLFYYILGYKKERTP